LFKPRRGKTLAAATRRPLRFAATANYEEIAEPNMKLSRALLIVLLLHVVAVAGIIAFNAIKTHQVSVASATTAANPTNHVSQAATKSVEAGSSPVATTRPEIKSVRPTIKAPDKDSKLPASSGKTYVVAKGDNPVTIARKFKVSYDDLLALNHIDD